MWSSLNRELLNSVVSTINLEMKLDTFNMTQKAEGKVCSGKLRHLQDT
jgi:biotin synthase-like enzyme